MGSKLFKILKVIFIILLLFVSIVPIFWIILTSFKTRLDILSDVPKFFFRPDLSAYITDLGNSSQSIWPSLINSIIIGICTVMITLTFGSLAAYACSRYNFWGKEQFIVGVLITRLLPPFTAIIPLFMMIQKLGIFDTHLVLIIINSALNIPLAIWMIKTYFDCIPKELEEAAMLDGCTSLQGLLKVTLPLAAPGLTATAIFVFVMSWNEFLFAFMFTSVKASTMPLLIAQARGEDQIFWQQMASQATILMVPMLLFSLFMQKHMVKGLTAGGVK